VNEERLIKALNDKDPAALAHLYDEYHGRILAVVRKYISDDWDAEEVVQDTFWTVYRKIHLFRGDSKLYSWMYRIAANEAKMKLRKYKRRPIPFDDDVLKSMHASDSIERVDSRPDRLLNHKRMLIELERFLNECDDTNRELYVSMEMEGIPKEEVAEKLDLTVPAVKTRLHRLRVGLRERLEPLHAAAA
jgi:RNA polymerase sigma-70 factor (ECF subfamily)